MKIQDFGTLQMTRTDKAHFGQTKIQPLTQNAPGMAPIQKIQRADKTTEAASIPEQILPTVFIIGKSPFFILQPVQGIC